MRTRRRFLQSAAALGLGAPAKSAVHKAGTTAGSIYDELGVRTLINGQGVVNVLLLHPDAARSASGDGARL